LTIQLSFSVGAVGVSGTIGTFRVHFLKLILYSTAGVIKSFERFHSQGMKIFGSIWLVFALLCDVMISAVLTWNLVSILATEFRKLLLNEHGGTFRKEKNRASTKTRIICWTGSLPSRWRTAHSLGIYFSCQQPERFTCIFSHILSALALVELCFFLGQVTCSEFESNKSLLIISLYVSRTRAYTSASPGFLGNW
jgi:hypothetical protein